MIIESIILGVCLCIAARTIGRNIVIASKIRMGEKWKFDDEDEVAP